MKMRKVLVVDDSPIIFKMIKRVLEPQGFEMAGYAENGQIGLEMFERYNPDLVTLDITMPVMNGLEMAAALFKKHPGAKVIMLSSMDDEDLIIRAKENGLRFFLCKPIVAEELLQMVQTILEK